MAQKERYVCKKISKDCLFPEILCELKDTESKFFVVLESKDDAVKIADLLNQQDKRIKELEEESGYVVFVDGYNCNNNEIHRQEFIKYKDKCSELIEENKKFKEQISKIEETHKRTMSDEYTPVKIDDLVDGVINKDYYFSTVDTQELKTANIFAQSNIENNKVYIWGYELCKGSEWKDFLEVVNKLGEENKRLKQSQKQLAIEKLERLKNYFCEEDEDGDGIKTGDWTITHDACEIAEFIDEQLKELKGGEDKK